MAKMAAKNRVVPTEVEIARIDVEPPWPVNFRTRMYIAANPTAPPRTIPQTPGFDLIRCHMPPSHRPPTREAYSPMRRSWYPPARASSSIWQSNGLLIRRFGVRVPGGPPPSPTPTRACTHILVDHERFQ